MIASNRISIDRAIFYNNIVSFNARNCDGRTSCAICQIKRAALNRCGTYILQIQRGRISVRIIFCRSTNESQIIDRDILFVSDINHRNIRNLCSTSAIDRQCFISNCNVFFSCIANHCYSIAIFRCIDSFLQRSIANTIYASDSFGFINSNRTIFVQFVALRNKLFKFICIYIRKSTASNSNVPLGFSTQCWVHNINQAVKGSILNIYYTVSSIFRCFGTIMRQCECITNCCTSVTTLSYIRRCFCCSYFCIFTRNIYVSELYFYTSCTSNNTVFNHNCLFLMSTAVRNIYACPIF